MAAWNIEERPDPEPCKENNTGVFEITCRDGRARLGKIHTQHGIVNTPCLLPVINPNIQTISPQDMWSDYGIEALLQTLTSFGSMNISKQRRLLKGCMLS